MYNSLEQMKRIEIARLDSQANTMDTLRRWSTEDDGYKGFRWFVFPQSKEVNAVPVGYFDNGSYHSLTIGDGTMESKPLPVYSVWKGHGGTARIE